MTSTTSRRTRRVAVAVFTLAISAGIACGTAAAAPLPLTPAEPTPSPVVDTSQGAAIGATGSASGNPLSKIDPLSACSPGTVC
ncbi:hypothetical protein [Nocardia australiensis]|uniref:hypothetical protein n=1 Tax=Nocardia australiensis TaxID=2887191 RepID=UPI001D14159B|nr:hypothetical protein [Nocardia australiensis]